MMSKNESPKRASDLSPEKLALLVMRMKKKAAEKPQGGGAIPRRSADGPPPLSFAQQRLWLLDRLEPGTSAYNMPFPARLLGSLDREALARALAEILRRHESLRTRFTTFDGVPVQVIEPPAAASLPLVDLSGLSRPAAREEGDRLLATEAKTAIDIERGPLCRLALIHLDPSEHLLLVNMHHIISDGWSLGLFFNELSVLYEAFLGGRPSPLPELPIQYSDFAVWQRDWLQGPVLEEQLAYWRGQLAGSPSALELPTDRLRPAVQTHRGDAIRVSLPASLTLALRELTRREGASMFMTLLAGFNVLLSRLTGQEDVVVGSPSAGRRRMETEGLIGLFLNVLVLRTDLSGAPSFQELLARVKTVVLNAYRYQEVPFERLLEELQPERVLSRSPFFQVLFNMVSLPDAGLAMPALQVEPVQGKEPDSKFDFTLYLQEQGDVVHVNMVYNADLFERARMEEMLRQFERVLAQVVAAPGASLGALSLVTPEARLLLPEPAAPLGGEWLGSVHEAVGRAAARFPERPAVAGWREDEVWTYGELEARSNQLAHFLRAGDVQKGDVVALWAHRGASLVWAVLGTLKAGAAFMILDPAYPSARLIDYLRIGRPRAWVAVAGAAAPPAEVAAALPALGLELPHLPSIPEDFLAGIPATDPEISVGPEDAACITFTSGSTGKPKGVVGRHGPLSHFYPWMGRRFGLSESDRFGMLSALSHDPLQRDLFTPLWFGATICIPEPDRLGMPRYLAEWIRRQEVSVLHLTPAMMELVTLSAEEAPAGERDLPSLRLAFVVGDLLKKAEVARLQRLAAELTCVNLYGSTETQRSVGYFVVPRPETPEAARLGRDVLPLGRGMEDVQLLILNQASGLAGVGEVGEIYVRSHHLAHGYLGDEALTAQRFLANPFGGETGDKVYRTGDLGRYLPDGNAEFAGRADFQVKLRGFRIELGEIEAALARFPGVRDCVVVVREDRPGDRRLVAYLVATAPPPTRDLHAFLTRHLPDYMVPSGFVTLAALPLTATGKVDRQALPEPVREETAVSAAELHETHPVEELLAGIWTDLLGVPGVKRQDNFFELGGHSLLATRMMSRVRDALGVELPLRAIFEEPTVAGLAAVIEQALRVGVVPPAPPIVPVPRDGELPLSFSQRRLWFLDHLDPDSFAYNLAGGVRLVGKLDADAFARCLTEISRRHESLRTRFDTVEGEPVAVIEPPAPFALPLVDLTGLAEPERESTVLRLANEEARRPFDLARGPLLRCALVRLGEREHALLIAMHHIVSDGWSLGVLVRDLGTLYPAFVAGRPSPLPELPVQYADFAHWQRSWLRGEILEGQLAWWRQHLDGAPPVLELPTDRPRPAIRTHRGGEVFYSLGADLYASLETVSRRLGVTPFMTFLGAFAVLLSRYSGQRDLVLGIPIANRNHSEVEDLIGFFASTLVLRVNLESLGGDPPFAFLARRVREEALGAYAHQDLPFEKLVDELQPERNLSHSPIFQVMLALQNVPFTRLELPGLTLSSLPTEGSRATFDLNLSLMPVDGGLGARLDFDADLFDAATAERLTTHWLTLLAGIAADPVQRASALPLLAEAERLELLVAANSTAAEIPGRGLHELFEDTAARWPGDVAVAFEGTRLTYGELNARANRLAHALRGLGVGPEVLVGLCVERSLDMLVGLLGVLKAGGAYVPLDPSYPSDRLAYVLEDGKVPLLLTQGALAGELAGLGGHGTRIVEIDSSFEGESAENPPPLSGPENRAYVIYTSGSTGRPKGVEVRHRGAVNFLASMARRPGLERRDVMVAVTTIAFDIAVLEIFLPLALGARVELVGRETAVDGSSLTAVIAESGATAMQATPATWRLLLEAGWTGSPGLKVLCGGEALPPDLAEQLLARVGSLWNVYGPTETTVWSAIHPVAAGALDDGGVNRRPIPIGKPIANTSIYLLDRSLEPVPPGAAGELYIGGEGLARGYVGRADLTAERFVPDPFGDLRGVPGGRLYRTGDLARYLQDGTLDFLGRVDHQVKIRGFRIELGEIESVLAAEPAVRECAVVVREDVPGTKRLTAYLVPEGEAPASAELRAALSAKLPEYMVPQLFLPLAALPLTPNGKVDRRALVRLPAPEEAGAGREYVAPRNPVEEILAAVWAEVLHLERVGVTDNFFELGGDSILTIQVVARCKKRGLRFAPRHIFQHQTIAGLALVTEVEAVRREHAGPVPLAPAQALLLQAGGTAFERWSDAVLLDLPAGLGAEIVEQALNVLVSRHDALRLRFAPTTNGSTGTWTQQPLEPADPAALLAVEGFDGPLDAAAAETLRDGVDLVRKPLLAVLSSPGAGPARLLIAAHPMVLDGWSFHLLIEELAAACEAVRLGAPLPSPATSSFRSQAETSTTRPAPPDAKGDPAARAVGAASTLGVSLGPDDTLVLLDEALRAYGNTVEEVLLAALTDAYVGWTGARDLRVEVAGTVSGDLDEVRAIGCLGIPHPAHLERKEAPGDLLKGVKERLRHLSPLGPEPVPEVGWSWQGELDGAAGWRGERLAPRREPGALRRHLLDVEGWVSGGCLRVAWTFSDRVHRRDAVQALSDRFLRNLSSLIQHCQASAGGFTPSDFPVAGLSQEDLDDLLAELS